MRILILAPHPFYQERGTPIAVDLLARAFGERGDEVSVLTFHEGEDREYDRLTIYRIRPLIKLRNIRPGMSVKKLVCDVFLFFKFISLMIKNRYDVVHAVEESAFMAMVVCPLFTTPYIYDMDSSMTTQIVDKYKALRFLESPLRWLESLPMRFANVVVPVCDALADEVSRYRKNNIVVLKDVSLLDTYPETQGLRSLQDECALKGKIVMYIGNLEPYQGIDLLLDSFRIVNQTDDDVSLIIIGGEQEHISDYQEKAKVLGISDAIHFLGKRSVGHLGRYMAQADILVSPRIHGDNTPMKVYSYMHSGTAVVATELPTHTQVMSREVAMLANPDKHAFASAIHALLHDSALRSRLAQNAKAYIEREYSYEAFKSKLFGLYASLEQRSARV